LGRYSDRQLVVPDLHLEARESPRILVALGRLRARSRLFAATADLVVRRRDASTFSAARGDEEIADVSVQTDEEAVAVVLRFLTLVPESPGCALSRSGDATAWRPARPLRDDLDPAALSCRELAAGVFDQHSLLAFDAAGDASLLVGLARLAGYPATFVIAGSDPAGIGDDPAGLGDAPAGLGDARLRRLLRVARITSRFRLPILFFQHGAAYERAAVEGARSIERLAELITVLHDADVPKLCVVTARGHVLGDFVLGGRELGTHYVAAWAQARVGVEDLPAFTVDTAAAMDAAAAAGEDTAGPWQAAGLGLIDDVILPGETPGRLAAMLGLLAPSRAIPPQHLDYDRRILFR
jgi:propionyl-CoA carboxylase beta chain